MNTSYPNFSCELLVTSHIEKEEDMDNFTSLVCSLTTLTSFLRKSFHSCPKLERTGAREREQTKRDVFQVDVKGGWGLGQSLKFSSRVIKRADAISIATRGGCGFLVTLGVAGLHQPPAALPISDPHRAK